MPLQIASIMAGFRLYGEIFHEFIKSP